MKLKIIAVVGSIAFYGILPAADTSPAPSTPPATYSFVATDGAAVADLVQYGNKAIEQVGALLISETSRELASKETSLAVTVLHLKNLELPKPIAGKPTVTAIKFTSMQVRNPRNNPDDADQAALNMIHGQLDEHEAISKLILQRIEHRGAAVEWRVYRPIAASKSCLACHGDPGTFRPGVKEALDRYYPEDKATGYYAQEWRGFIRVSLTEPVALPKK